MINTIEKLAAYNVWANNTLLGRLDEIARSGQEIPAVCLRLFSHVLNAQHIWIARLTGTQSPVKVWQEHTLEVLHQLHEQTSERLHQMAQAADDAELHRTISYSNSVGDSYVSQVSDILTHVHVHANYHRGQVATRLREHDLEPINTDFITYCRELTAAGKETVSL
ncbi:DinB family protein [Hymenobacter jejuensis]|uniref:Damage-inducible protein DinB n=1 Tax=Hymenobacter jejuensis TaxID=2502781 RepID=A0A5B7ZZ25_9BACT|nr:DinB family protein [Hymenobacter jejuensis]QDA60099.1 damage-inducible protein DinB [Hymenobacter jejuensis]